MIDYKKLSSLQLDALKEVGNIGAAHAATALSQILNRTIMINISQFEIIPISDVSKIVGGLEKQAVAIKVQILGDVVGAILLVFTREDALSFADILKARAPGVTRMLDESDESTLKESGSILSASYLQAIGGFLKLSLISSLSGLLCGKMGNILENVFIELNKRAEVAFCIETEFVEAKSQIKGHFLLIPEVKGLELMLRALGLV